MLAAAANAVDEAPATASSPTATSTVQDMLRGLCVQSVPDKTVPPAPGVSKAEICRCVADRLSANPALQPTLEGMHRGELQPSSAQGPVVASMMGAILICEGQIVEKLAPTGTMPEGKGFSALKPYFGEAADPVPQGAPLVPAAAPQAQGTYERATIKPEKRCEPSYPKYAAETNATGTTMVALYVTAAGRVSKVRVNRSSGDTIGHKLLDLTAMTALAACPVQAAMQDGRPVGSWLLMEYEWRLR
ncbi:energy transducer TonB [Ideonella dechloratans]|uniref:energy transducer TonB n=1 Tax=Ideonella dechloratans TaxID=36863 RepID=UPI0035B3F179